MQLNLKNLSALSLLITLSIGCSSKKDANNAEFNALVTGASAKAREIQPLPETIRGIPLRPKMDPVVIKNELKSDLCAYLIEEKEATKTIGEHFSNPQGIAAANSLVQSLEGRFDTCEMVEVSVSAFPLEISKFKLGENEAYLLASLNLNQKVNYMTLIPAMDGLKIENKFLKTTDGRNLHTVVMSFDDQVKRGTVFLKTPYFETSHLQYVLSAFDNFVAKGFNFVLQSNRGAHLSEGDFKWLDKLNIDDSYETMDWITAQDFSNGKVMSYGVSYDGYNALAASVSNHPSLKSVVSCSSPANAATDSFSSNKSIEIHLLTYIAGREQAQQIISNQEVAIVLSTAALADWDNIMYGRDLGDWDATIEAVKDLDSDYWVERSLIEGLKKSSIETIHVAGLSFDQDSRDTLLAYEEIQNNGVTPEKHRLFLHPNGHGCGGLEQTAIIDGYLSKITDTPIESLEIPQVMQFSLANSTWMTGDSYPLTDHIEKKEFTLTLDEELNGDLASSEEGVVATMIEDPTSDLGENNMAILAVEMTEDVFINGSIEIVLPATSEAPETRINAKVYYSMEGVQFGQIQQFESGLARTSAVTMEETEEELEMIYPPRLLEIKKGTKIYVHLLTNDYSHIQGLSPEREQFFMSQNQAKVSILEGAKLVLPLEKVQIRELAQANINVGPQ